MRHLQQYESYRGIDRTLFHLKQYGIHGYTINDDGYIDVDNNVYLEKKDMLKIPLKFGHINYSFYIFNNKLDSLENCPISVRGHFYSNVNKLTNLNNSPTFVGGNFNVSENKLTSLVGCPKKIGCNFTCSDNHIDTFEGLDFVRIGWSFYCDGNPIYKVWRLFKDHTKFEFFNDCDPIRENRVIILDRLNFFLDYIGKRTVTEVEGYKCI